MKRLAALAVAAFLAACTLVPMAGPQRTDTRFAQVHAGMTKEAVRALLGPPDEVMPFPLSHTDSWGYYYWDGFGYHTLWSATFAADGHVVSTFARRLNDGGDMK